MKARRSDTSHSDSIRIPFGAHAGGSDWRDSFVFSLSAVFGMDNFLLRLVVTYLPLVFIMPSS